MTTILLLAALLGQTTFPTNDARPGGATNLTGCMTWTDGTQWCSSANGIVQVKYANGSIGIVQASALDSVSGDLAIGNVNASNVKIGATATPVVVTPSGAVTAPGAVGGASIAAAAAGAIGFTGRGQLTSPADGQLDIKNTAGTSTVRVYTTATDHGISPPNFTTDTNALPFTIHPANVAANATAARTASNLVLAGSLASKTAYFADANPDTGGHCVGTTVVLTVNGTANVLTYNTYCSGGCTTTVAANTALAAAVGALPGVGATVGAITGGVASAVLVTANQPATVSVAWSGATTSCLVTSNGTDGVVNLPNNVTVGGTLGITGATTATGLLSANGGISLPAVPVTFAGFSNVVAANAVTIYKSNGPVQKLTLAAATGAVALTFSGFVENDSLRLTITQHASAPQNITTWTNGAFTTYWANGVAPTITVVNSARDVISCTFESTAIADCFVAGQAMTAGS